MPLTPGSNFGPYRVIEQLGKGGMATVYKAYEAGLDRYVALKVLPAEFLHDETFSTRFRREAKVVARLEHKDIIPIYAFGIDEGLPWMAMRLIRGGPLSAVMKSERLGLDRAVGILEAVAEALGYAHGQGVVHRDLKPQNVLLDEDGGVYLADFGIARMLEGSTVLTRTGLVTGTPQYMAPEQGLGEPVDHRADIYALGIVAYEMFTGRVPFEANTPLAVLMKHVRDPIPLEPIRSLPDTLQRALLKALAKDPADRWPSPGAFVSALAESLGTSPPSPAPSPTAMTAALPAATASATEPGTSRPTTPADAPEPEPPSPRPAPRPRAPVLLAIVIGVVAGVGAAGAYLLLRTQRGGVLPELALALPQDTGLVIGIEARRLQEPLRPLLSGDFSGLPAPPEVAGDLPRLKRKIDRDLDEVEREFGLRLEKDVDRVVIGFSNLTAREPSLTVLVQGRFDRARMQAAIMREGRSPPEVKDVQGVSVYVRGRDGLAILGDESFLIGQLGTVEDVIRNRASGAKPLASNQTVMRLADRIRRGSVVWGVGTDAFVGLIRREAGEVPFPLPTSVVVSEHLGSGLEVLAQMADEGSAKSLAAVIEGGLAWLRTRAGSGSSTESTRPDVTADGSELRVRLSPPPGGRLPASLAFFTSMAAPALARTEAAAKEALVIGDIRTMISAQTAFSAESGGFYGELNCLSDPKSCLPDSQAQPFLWLATTYVGESSGYRRSFFPGPAGPRPALLQSFAYAASPVVPGATGRRSFCGDSSGIVCADPEGGAIAADGGQCPTTCQPLR